MKELSVVRLIAIMIIARAVCNAQVPDNLNPTVYPYGGVIANDIIHSITTLTFTNPVHIENANFATLANFAHARFKSDAIFYNVRFTDKTEFLYSLFHSHAFFQETQFTGSTNFRGTRFYKEADFAATHFKGSADFSRTAFSSYANLMDAQFDSSADFSYVIFGQNLWLDRATFQDRPNFEGTYIVDTLSLDGTRFLKGVDLRRTYFNPWTAIYYDDHTFFPVGELWIQWDQLKGRLRLADIDSNATKYENIRRDVYNKAEIFYCKLRDNFKMQGEYSSTDEVMYELASQRAQLLGEFAWKLYGWFFGWGYQPWRFILFIALPLILAFALIWYCFYYEIVMRVVDDKIDAKYGPRTDKLTFSSREVFPLGKKMFSRLMLQVYDHANSGVGLSYLYRSWHVVFFSASVLLGIRIKKEWIQVVPPTSKLGQRTFLPLLTLEWLLGIALYVVFALLVKGSRFDFIKELLGF